MKLIDIDTVTDEDFVKWWLESYKEQIGLIGMVKKHNLLYRQASARASKLRNAGVKLPTMVSPLTKKNGLEINVKKLNDMVVAELGEEALSWRTR